MIYLIKPGNKNCHNTTDQTSDLNWTSLPSPRMSLCVLGLYPGNYTYLVVAVCASYVAIQNGMFSYS